MEAAMTTDLFHGAVLAIAAFPHGIALRKSEKQLGRILEIHSTKARLGWSRTRAFDSARRLSAVRARDVAITRRDAGSRNTLAPESGVRIESLRP